MGINCKTQLLQLKVHILEHNQMKMVRFNLMVKVGDTLNFSFLGFEEIEKVVKEIRFNEYAIESIK